MNDGAERSSIVVQRPATALDELVLLFHGVGASADDLVPLAQRVAQARPHAFVASIGAPFPFGMGAGRQWFSVLGVTEQDRPARVAAAMPAFAGAVAHWQAESGVDAARTTLIGFSQGAIMALESTQAELPQPLARRVVAIAGRFAQPVRCAPAGVALHLIHGAVDPVIPAQQSVQAVGALRQLGAADTTLDVLPGLGHGVDGRVVDLVLSHLDAA
ncbi:esterase [Ramlibacter sp.]|uniref:esterase n=1 Tax=Ramlibacter sp. TaxID=1917967 RepID=UPI0017A77687|nr:esterase [Ramlibacter sp.]MBA2673366.1 esterase [Ramlibacter sp.]